MVYVFGIENVPIFEMIFIIMVLMLAGLVFILIELKKLRELIALESSDISRFEKDLAAFESQKEDGSASDEMLEYVKNAKAKGMSDEKIEDSLVSLGWKKDLVEDILKKI